MAELADLYGWHHHHAMPGLTRAGYFDGFPSEVLLRGGRLVLVAIADARSALTPPAEAWLQELAAVSAVETRILRPHELGDLTDLLRPAGERMPATGPRKR